MNEKKETPDKHPPSAPQQHWHVQNEHGAVLRHRLSVSVAICATAHGGSLRSVASSGRLGCAKLRVELGCFTSNGIVTVRVL